jgi:hypothetical protein
MNATKIHRRAFFERSAVAGAAAALGNVVNQQSEAVASDVASAKRVRVGVIGCGSVSGAYLPHLAACPFVELISTCDIISERAEGAREAI